MDIEIPKEFLSLQLEIKYFNRIYEYFIKANIIFDDLFKLFPDVIPHIICLFRCLNDIGKLEIDLLKKFSKLFIKLVLQYKYLNLYEHEFSLTNRCTVVIPINKCIKLDELFNIYNIDLYGNPGHVNGARFEYSFNLNYKTILGSYTVGILKNIFEIFCDYYYPEYIKDIRELIYYTLNGLKVKYPIYKMRLTNVNNCICTDLYDPNCNQIIKIYWEKGQRNLTILGLTPHFIKKIKEGFIIDLKKELSHPEKNDEQEIIKWFITKEYCDKDSYDNETGQLRINRKTNIKSAINNIE